MALEKSAAELARIFSGPPDPPGKSRYHHMLYDLVQLPDGTIGFIRNAFDAEMNQIFAEIIAELFGPEPAEDVELLSGRI
jgi:hypothetical protein